MKKLIKIIFAIIFLIIPMVIVSLKHNNYERKIIINNTYNFHNERFSENITKEKENIINSFINFLSTDKKQIVINKMRNIPICILKKMQENKLKINFIEKEKKSKNSTIILGEYKPNINTIYIYNQDINCESLIHEIGHWLHHYIQNTYNINIFDYISKNMKKESKNIIINPFNNEFEIEYMNSNTNEFYAEGFNQYIKKNLDNTPEIKKLYDFSLSILQK